ncbi:hypothetical protein [Pantoea vagans]|uniref:hypothetical protein n=1 Tax=Pantoea vagans TaxID=470934 RepID=UPI001093D9AE|nr:hypothetical protein [Pantoea vagans]QCA03508.1 hypothetical protein EGO56_04755 [Pantoea vagans]
MSDKQKFVNNGYQPKEYGYQPKDSGMKPGYQPPKQISPCSPPKKTIDVRAPHFWGHPFLKPFKLFTENITLPKCRISFSSSFTQHFI